MDSQLPPKSQFEVEIYKQASENCRFYGDMRFKQLTLFGVISGLLLNVLKDAKAPQDVLTIGSIGMIATIVMWIMEVRSFVHWLRAVRRTGLLEKQAVGEARRQELASSEDPGANWTLVNASNAVLLLYVISYLFWYFLFLRQAVSRFLFSGGLLFGLGFLFLLVFSAVEYGPALRHARGNWKWR